MFTYALRTGVCALLAATGGFAASHRNGPLLLEDQTANLNDFYFFRSWETGRADRVVLSMSAQGFQNPQNGPSYYKFSDSVLYRFNVNNSRGLDGIPDIQIDFVFRTALNPNAPFVSYFGLIDNIDSEGIFLKQTYQVVIRNLRTGTSTFIDRDRNGHVLSVAPPNQGPKATPSYEERLGSKSVFELSNGWKVFAGPRDDAFYFDSAATFDFLNFRAPAPVLAGGDDASPGPAYPRAVDGFAGYNISLIAVEVPIGALTSTGAAPANSSDPARLVGAWASTLRQQVTIRRGTDDPLNVGEYNQVDRVGNPLTVELLIPLPMKDRWNRNDPVNDAQFRPLVADPFIAQVLKGLGLNIPPAPRADLMGVFIPDLTRLDLSVPAKAPGDSGFSRLGPVAGDNAGWPNGRRIGDDVVDIGLRAVAGVLVPGFGTAPNTQLGDGVNSNDLAYLSRFPFHAPPHAGYAHSQQEGTNGRGKATQ